MKLVKKILKKEKKIQLFGGYGGKIMGGYDSLETGYVR
jgi:hypothetical protein